MEPSKYQKAIYDFVTNNTGNAIVNAVAGSGKTTTGVAMIELFPPESKGKFMAFGKKIADELAKRITHPNATSSTYNAAGNSVLRANLKAKFELSKIRNIVNYKVLKGDEKKQKKMTNQVIRVVSLMKNLYDATHTNWERWYDRVIAFADIEVPEDPTFKAVTLETFTLSLVPSIIDYNDQKFFPVYMNMPFETFDFLVIDEFQDTSPVEYELIKRFGRNARIFPFGDPDQAIFKFKGADESIFHRFGATTLPLSVCYRCPKAVVRHAQTLVPRIEYNESSIEGSVDTVKEDYMFKNIGPRDMVLSRTNADAISYCLKLISNDRPSYVLGKEVADKIENLIWLVGKSTDDIFTFKSNLDLYYHDKYTEYDKLGYEGAKNLLEDNYEVLCTLIPGCGDVAGLISKMRRLIVDVGEGIVCMTAHKSKGLESGRGNKTWIVRPDKFPHPKATDELSERRLHYVAITRAQDSLFYVSPPERK